eukprot:1553771-Rhodomonas_salina.1
MIFNRAANNTEVKDSIVTESNSAVKDKLGSNWTDWSKCGYSTEESYKKQVARIRLNFMIKINRVLIERILTAIFGADHWKKTSREAEALTQLLITSDVKQLLTGIVDASTWEDKPHQMLAVRMWAKILFKYEGVHDFSSSQRIALPQHPRQTFRSLTTNLIQVQVKMSQRLALP